VAPATKGLDVKDPLPPRGEGGVFSLDIPFYRTQRDREHQEHHKGLDFCNLSSYTTRK